MKKRILLNVFQSNELGAASYACINVEDDGCGMSGDIIDRVFEPYFSTKGAKGTGLGLSTVRDIIEQIGGAILFESEQGEGTCARVFLPVLGEYVDSEEEVVDDGGELDLEGGSERILIVDDEASVRNVLVMSLEHLGYEVVAVENGAAAIELFSKKDSSFDLVILDMLMPNMPGEVVFERLQQIDSDVRVLLISGFSSEAAVLSVLERGGLGFIQKPFTIEELSAKVRDCFK